MGDGGGVVVPVAHGGRDSMNDSECFIIVSLCCVTIVSGGYVKDGETCRSETRGL
jgi:hypothetical protein